jgi:hypothetical protein
LATTSPASLGMATLTSFHFFTGALLLSFSFPVFQLSKAFAISSYHTNGFPQGEIPPRVCNGSVSLTMNEGIAYNFT